jgi:hypothetical protein
MYIDKLGADSLIELSFVIMIVVCVIMIWVSLSDD